MSALEGMLLVDKPPGVTSHDVVQVVRRRLGVQRVGHTGTLDPVAKGLLILLVGQSAKYQQAFQHQEKTYEAVVRFGLQTDTGDRAGKPLRTAPLPLLDERCVTEMLQSFRGAISQVPPTYSAVKVRGRPAYWWARRQRPVTLRARTVHISDVALIGWSPETVTFTIRCSAGTYVRTLAESMAERLGTVGHLSALTRLRIGDWRLEDAKPLSWIAQAGVDELARHLLPVGARLS